MNYIEATKIIERELALHQRVGAGVSVVEVMQRCSCTAAVLDHNKHQAQMIADVLDVAGVFYSG